MSRLLAQLRAIAYYELLMLWRRGWIRLIALTLILAPLLMAVFSRVLFPPASSLEHSTHMALEVVTSYIASLLTAVALPGVLVPLPVMTVEIIPLDQKYGVWDLLNALPIQTRIYLTGKPLGAWGGLTFLILTSMSIVGLGTRLIIGQYDLKMWVHLWLIGLLPFAYFTLGISLLLSASQRSRRTAAFLGAILVIPCVMGFFGSPLARFYVWITSQLVARQDWTGFLSELPQILTISTVLAGTLTLTLACGIGWGLIRRQQYRV